MSRVVERLFLTVPRGCLQFVIVVFPDHTHLLFLSLIYLESHLNFYQTKIFFSIPIINCCTIDYNMVLIAVRQEVKCSDNSVEVHELE